MNILELQNSVSEIKNVLDGFKSILAGIAWLAVQWLGLHAPTAGGTGLITGWGTGIPRDSRPK